MASANSVETTKPLEISPRNVVLARELVKTNDGARVALVIR